MGFGHRVYKHGDPRAKHLKEMSKRLTNLTGESKWYEMSIRIEEIVTSEKSYRLTLISIRLLFITASVLTMICSHRFCYKQNVRLACSYS